MAERRFSEIQFLRFGNYVGGQTYSVVFVHTSEVPLPIKRNRLWLYSVENEGRSCGVSIIEDNTLSWMRLQSTRSTGSYYRPWEFGLRTIKTAHERKDYTVISRRFIGIVIPSLRGMYEMYVREESSSSLEGNISATRFALIRLVDSRIRCRKQSSLAQRFQSNRLLVSFAKLRVKWPLASLLLLAMVVRVVSRVSSDECLITFKIFRESFAIQCRRVSRRTGLSWISEGRR